LNIREKGPKTLTLVLTLLVFLIMSSTMIIMGVVIFILLNLGWLPEKDTPAFLQLIIFTMILSIAIGTTLARLFSKAPLKPFRQLIDATEQMAKGNFDIRINLKYPQEMVNLSNSFNKMAEELGGIELLRSDFVNNFSHEFKTPIVSIRGFAKVLKNSNLSSRERDEYLDIIISETERLSSLATNVLTLTNVENLKIVTKNQLFDLSEQIRRSILVLESKWSEKKLTMQIDLDEVMFNGNEDLLNHIWLNLIDNAIKFSPQHAEIIIELQKVNHNIIFKVADNGYGLTEESKKRIFDKFYQGDTSRAIEGNGIGLAIVHKIVSLYNGSIKVESELEIGTVFTVVLPTSLPLPSGSET